MLTQNIRFKNFKIKKKDKKIKNLFLHIIKEKSHILLSLGKNYRNSFSKKILKKYKNFVNFRVIGMGGSTLGTQAIYEFLNHKIKKKFIFFDNLLINKIKNKNNKKSFLNLIVSKSGNTLETILNANILIKKKIRIFL